MMFEKFFSNSRGRERERQRTGAEPWVRRAQLPARVRARQRACLRGWLLCAFVCVLSGGPRGFEFFPDECI